jgi:CubicO group peptidase (beta-lactamase class C family)
VSKCSGSVDPAFAAVREAFEQNFRERGEVGAACCLYVSGRAVVELWGGVADSTDGRPWTADTIALVFSATKGATAICVNQLVERGLLDLDAPIGTFWPEFAASGKESVTTRMVLSHRAGVAAIDGTLTLDEVLAGAPVVAAIAATAPQWPPGTAHGYHMRSFGWILGEVVRRVTGRRLGRYFAEEIAGPLGLDFWIGLPDELVSRCCRLKFPPPGLTFPNVTPLTVRISTGPSGLFGYNDMWNRPEILRAEMPSSNGVGSAAALARMYAATIGEIDGVRLLKAATVRAATVEQSNGPDLSIPIETRFGLGFALPPMLSTNCGPASFGHPGAGGSLGFADPEASLAFGYVTNDLRFDPTGDPRVTALLEAVYDCLGAA